MKTFLFLAILLVATIGFSENYLLNGGQNSTIQYKMTQSVEPQPGIVSIDLSYVIPESFASPTYNQEIKNFNVTFNIEPAQKNEWIDKHNNKILKYSWSNLTQPIDVALRFEATNHV